MFILVFGAFKLVSYFLMALGCEGPVSFVIIVDQNHRINPVQVSSQTVKSFSRTDRSTHFHVFWHCFLWFRQFGNFETETPWFLDAISRCTFWCGDLLKRSIHTKTTTAERLAMSDFPISTVFIFKCDVSFVFCYFRHCQPPMPRVKRVVLSPTKVENHQWTCGLPSGSGGVKYPAVSCKLCDH